MRHTSGRKEGEGTWSQSTACKKVPVPFPAPSRDVTDYILSSQEYVSITKSGVFPDIPFPSPEFLQNPFESGNVPVYRQEFPRFSFSPVIHNSSMTKGPYLKHLFFYLYSTCVLCTLAESLPK